MSQRTATCRVCGAELEGRDVYEGICRSCREDEVLGGRPRPRKPKPPPPEPKPPLPEPKPPLPEPKPEPAPAAPAIQKAPPPAAEPPIDMDADTKELAALAERGGRRRPEAEADASGPTLDADIGAMPLAIDEGEELPVIEVTEVDEDEAAPVAIAIRVEEDEPQPGHDLPVSQVATGTPEAGDGQSPAPTTPPEPHGLRLDDEHAAKPPVEPLALETRQEPEPVPEPPPDLKIRLDHPAAVPAPPPRRTPARADETPPPPARLRLDPELDARFRLLEARLEELADRLDHTTPSWTAGQQVKVGMRVFFGIVVAAGILALVAVGVVALLKHIL